MSVSVPDNSFRILMVCTGNVCRSPFAERLLQATFARLGIPVKLTSAGTAALQGYPMDDRMSTLAALYGIAGTGHLAQQLRPDLVANADLILGLTRKHRRDVVRMSPAKSRVSFTLTEFARLVDDAVARELLHVGAPDPTADSVREFVEVVISRRGLAVLPEKPSDDDIPDPYGRDDSEYYNSGALTFSAVTRIEQALRAAVVGKAA